MSSSPFSRPQTPKSRPSKEIAASDEDASDSGFSDNSLEDLSALLGRPHPHAAPRHSHDAFSTPKAKRAAHALHKSPLAIIPKHKFDLKALAKDARRDSALLASSIRAKEVAAREKSAAPSTPAGGRGTIPEPHSALSEIVYAEGGKDAHKIMRAVQRADTGNQELRYCFFRSEFDSPSPPKPPTEAMHGPWSLLTKGNQTVREQNIVSGVPYNIVRIQQGMPEPIFLWMLEEVCLANSAVVRSELCNLIGICHDQIACSITPNVLQSIWTYIGAEDVSVNPAEVRISKHDTDTYKGHDWSKLLTVLALLQSIASHLSLESTQYALKTLLRLAMDKIVLSNIDIENQFENTFEALIDTIPTEHWDSFCFDSCAMLESNFKSQCIRVNALLCLPISSYRANNLRRRLAITFLFNDASLSRRAPEEVITLQGIIDRLAESEFQVGPTTEFAELRAAILILDMAVDDGSVFTFTDIETENQFNDRVDELAGKLNEIWRCTNDTGMKLARTEAKSVVEWVQKRVMHTVRTRRKQPKSIFDLPGQVKQQQRRDLPKQQAFMKSFFMKKAGESMVEPKAGLAVKPAVETKPTPTVESKLEAKAEPRPQLDPGDVVMDSIVVKSG